MVAPVVKRFKFVSPGILINEIDNSFLPKDQDRLGPVVIGRTERGPGMRPTQVNSQAEFIEQFGNPIPGKGGGDIWREGNTLGPTYASYAAMAYLKNNGPVTVIRLLGTEAQDKVSGGEAGWSINSGAGQAWGLFTVESSSMGSQPYVDIVFPDVNGAPTNGDTIKLIHSGSAIGGSNSEYTITVHATDTARVDASNARAARLAGPAMAKNVADAINLASRNNISGSNQDHPFRAEYPAPDANGNVGTGTAGATAARIVRVYAPAAENILKEAQVQVNYSDGNMRVSGAALPGRDAQSIAVAGDDTAVFFYNGTNATISTGSLAAVWYTKNPNQSVILKGTQPGGSTEISGTAAWVKSVEDDSFKVQIVDNSQGVSGSWTKQEEVTFSMNPNANNFIRNMFNTNPTLLNEDITALANTDVKTQYFLGETFETEYHETVNVAGAGKQLGIILKLADGTANQAVQQRPATAAESGFVIAQDTSTNTADYDPANMQQLFKFKSKHAGAHDSGRYKVSIQDIKASSNPTANPYGSFTVIVRQTDDNDTTLRIVEQFRNCNLNPASSNYIARKIGDQFETWDTTERRYRQYGNFPSQSDIIYVEMNQDVDTAATDPILLPFGFLGPARHVGFGVVAGNLLDNNVAAVPVDFDTLTTDQSSNAFAKGGDDIFGRHQATRGALVSGEAGGTSATRFASSNAVIAAKLKFPSIRLRTSTEDLKAEGGNGKQAYFGIQTNRSGSNRKDAAYYDVVKNFPSGKDADASAANQEYSFKFSLDDLYIFASDTHATWSEQNRRKGISSTALTGSYEGILDAGFDQFTLPLWGGTDGLDITEKEPFNNTDLAGKEERTSAPYNSLRRSIDMLADPEAIEFNIATIPGITNPGITTHLINTVEQRADALAIIDLESGYLPHTENANGDADATNRGSVTNTVRDLKNRRLNSSYACAYYPWVRIADPFRDSSLWAPPSVVALGTMGSSETKSELWFAPAGFTRGGLTEGSAGLPVLSVRERLTSKERDKLYDANINPIATFPAEGIVIFGQKTLQVTPSALDRINVRRLMVFVKKEISRMAATVLFDQNVQRTWNRFLGKVNPFLRSVQARLGLMDFKVVLDETTTTPDLIDRNIMYAKIFLKPAKAIEFIAIDFVITDSGASFED